MNKIPLTIAFGLLFLLLTACPNKSSNSHPPTSIQITPLQAAMYTGETKDFTAEIDRLSNQAPNNDITWEASCGVLEPNAGEKIQYRAANHSGICVITASWSEDKRISTSIKVKIVDKPAACVNPPAIPDKNLQRVIKRQLDISRNINCQDLESLSRLYDGWAKDKLDSLRIKSLSGLEHAVNLRSLTLVQTKLKDLSPISKLIKLDYLNLWISPIDDLSSLAGLWNLNRLILESNKISDIKSLKDLKMLSRLSLANNKISNISTIENLEQLSKLYLYGNKISDIRALEKLPKLKLIHLTDNLISDISPLLNNKGLSSQTEIKLDYNCLDVTASGPAMAVIKALQKRGVKLTYKNQKNCG